MPQKLTLSTIRERFMQRALDLAAKATGQTSPNPMVGCVIEKKGRVIAEGWHRRCGADHAEVVALKKAGPQARGARLYVNLEPCAHVGRTPPCVEKIIASGIKEVIIGVKDPNPLVSGRSIRRLRRAGIATTVGVLKEECARLNESFFKYIQTKTPWIVTKTAQTLDGKIATARGASKWITADETRQHARRERDAFDAILVGVNTVLADNPGLNGASPRKKIKKIVLDSTLKTPLSARLFTDTDAADCFIVTTTKASQAKAARFRQRGHTLLVSPGASQKINLKWLVKELGAREITSVLVEGGARVVGGFLKEKLVDKMHIYMAPKIIGDQDALSAVVGLNTPALKRAVHLDKLNIQLLGKDIKVTGYVLRNR